jgi:hypothetical protein
VRSVVAISHMAGSFAVPDYGRYRNQKNELSRGPARPTSSSCHSQKTFSDDACLKRILQLLEEVLPC